MAPLIPVAIGAASALFNFLSGKKKESNARRDAQSAYNNDPSRLMRESLMRALFKEYNLGQAFGDPTLIDRLLRPPDFNRDPRLRTPGLGSSLLNGLMNSTTYYKPRVPTTRGPGAGPFGV